MNNFIKKYWTHILNLSFLGYLAFLLGFLASNISSTDEPPAYLGLLFLVEIFMVIGIWVEIIYYMIKAIKIKNLKNVGLHIAGIYLLNVFYIPCFCLNHIHKDSKAKIKNFIYVLLSVG
ncbi:MAG: hypothetical protein K6B70_01995, partial [Clostridia bacterium]|nr:hypothetical protein [Clostridia bacterium]